MITSIAIKDWSYLILIKGFRGETKEMNIDNSAITTAAAKIVSIINNTFSNLSFNLQYQNHMNLLSHYWEYLVIKGD